MCNKSQFMGFTRAVALFLVCATVLFGFRVDQALAVTENVVWTSVANATVSGNTITRNSASLGGYGVSTQSITSGDGYLEFTAALPDGNRGAGLSPGTGTQELEGMRYAIRLNGATAAEVWQNGSYVTETTYATNDVFRIDIVGGVVKYKKNGTVFYTSAVAPTYPLLAHAAIYTNGSSINNAVITYGGSVTPPPPPPPVVPPPPPPAPIPTPAPTPTPTPAPTPPPPGTWPHEPVGSTRILSWPFDTLQGTDAVSGKTMFMNPTNNAAIVQSPNGLTVPFSSPNTLRITYPAGFVSGSAPAVFYIDPGSKTRYFTGLWWMADSNWEGEPSGVNKILLWNDSAAASQDLQMYGSPGGPYKMCFFQEQNTSSFGRYCGGPNVTLGSWHQLEIFMRSSTTSSSGDGYAMVWMDGTQIVNITNMNYDVSHPMVEPISPTWGGNTGAAKTRNSYYWIDHWYLSDPGNNLPPNGNTPIVGDVNLDHIVNSVDYSLFNVKWFTNDATTDFSHDGIVNSIDFSILNENWLKTW